MTFAIEWCNWKIVLRDLDIRFGGHNLKCVDIISETVRAGAQKVEEVCRFGHLPSIGVIARIRLRDLDLILESKSI